MGDGLIFCGTIQEALVLAQQSAESLDFQALVERLQPIF